MVTSIKSDVIKELMLIPETIKYNQTNVLAVAEKIERMKEQLKDKESELLLNGTIDGKNAEQRAAQLRMHTKTEQDAISTAEAELNRAKLELDYAYNRFKALRAIARILGGEVE